MVVRKTLFSDVCGTMDELKRRLCKEYQQVCDEPAVMLEPLLKDAEFMMGQMRKRQAENENFCREVRKIVSEFERVPEVETQPAERALALIRGCLKSGEDFNKKTAPERFYNASEDIRAVAAELEHQLRNCKNLALKLYDEFVAVKGTRPWLLTEQDSQGLTESIERKYQAWLPPEPHRGRLIEVLSESKAYIPEELLPDGQPMVQFEDGGTMPMSLVRWDDAVKNFHPAFFKPGHTGRSYRRNLPQE